MPGLWTCDPQIAGRGARVPGMWAAAVKPMERRADRPGEDFDRMQMSKRLVSKWASASGFAPKVDGRRLRSVRTKQRVIDALLELVREGNPNPRLGEIAERAGCVVRSIFDH